MTQSSEQHLVEHYSLLQNFNKDFRNANLFRLVATLVTRESVVDIGCGAGFFLGMLQERGKDVLGIEPNEGMRVLAEKVNPQVKVVAGSAEEVDRIVTAPVGTVTMLDVLEHVENDTEQVRRIRSILTPDGEFVLVVPAYPFLYGKRDIAMGHYRRYTKSSLEKLLTENGFSIVSTRYWNALGVLPYVVSEKIFQRPLRVRLREGDHRGGIGELLRKGIDFWMREFENRFTMGFGLSLICVAKKSE